VVIPAQSREMGGDAQHEMFIDDDAVGVATKRDASQAIVRRVEGEPEVRAEILTSRFAAGTGAVRVDQAADRREVAGLVFGNCRPHFRDAPDDLMARDNRVYSGHELAPLVADRMEVGVADAAKQDFDLHVAIGWIAARNRGGGQRRCCTGGGISFRFVHDLCPFAGRNPDYVPRPDFLESRLAVNQRLINRCAPSE
jgi:hypothetical protein